jgi:hypothetical protein
MKAESNLGGKYQFYSITQWLIEVTKRGNPVTDEQATRQACRWAKINFYRNVQAIV